MTACLLMSRIAVIHPSRFTSPTESNKAVCWPPPSLAWRSQQRSRMHYVGVVVRYRSNGRLFNLRRLKAKTMVQMDSVRDLLFADDCALYAGSQSDMQHRLDLFSTACDNVGLFISIKKTEVMHQPAPGKAYAEPTITVNGQKLSAVDRFTYLRSNLSRAVQIDDEVDTSIAFGRLRSNVWERRVISLVPKLKVFKAVILPSLLYACET